MRLLLVLLALLLALGAAVVSSDANAAPGLFRRAARSQQVALPACPVAPLATPTQAALAKGLPTELTDYVNKPDDSFTWKLADKTESGTVTVYTIDLVSQTWHGIKWDHKLQIFVPKDEKPQATMGLWNEGGAPSLRSMFIGAELAQKIKAPVALLFGIPKQPLYGGKVEDALIAESFVRYLTTEDPSWPLLFPMVKSIVRAMDAIQAFAKQEWKFEVMDFVIAGASKRGWTTWLTAATGDKRVKAIAPVVFDTLNLPVQMTNQVKSYGKFSDMVKDYQDRLLLPIPKTKPAERLWTIIDPWTYREKFTMPMMMVYGTNDEYWLLDGLNTYWDGLPGDKWVLYVPNAGHHLTQLDKNGKEELVPSRALNTLIAFVRSQIFNKPMPKLNCSILCPPDVDCLDVGLLCDVKPSKVCAYTTESATRDFRKCYWEARPLDLNGNKTECKVNLPKKGFASGFIELEFGDGGEKYYLSTPLRILEPKK